MTQGGSDRKFKVCLVSLWLARGGAERSCAMLSQMLTSHGHDVHIVVLNDAVEYPYEGTLFNLGKLKISNDTLRKRLKRFRLLRKYIRNQKFDVIIDHRPKNHYFREVFYRRYIYKGIPRIYVVHSSNKAEYNTSKPDKFAQINNGNIATVAVSDYIKNEILVPQGVVNAVTIHNAFNPDWKNNDADLPALLRDKSYLLSYGRLDDSVKDFSFLIHAFDASQIWKQGHYLVIMGSGPDEKKLKALANSVAASHTILFVPFISEPFAVIRAARFVTLTSRYEGFPMVLVESLSIGTPVVSLDIVSGPSEMIKHRENGLLVSERSIPLFAESLREMSENDPLYNQCKQQAEASVAHFSMAEISKKWNNLLQDGLS